MAVKFANNAKSTLNGAHNDSTTTIAVVDGSVFPTLSGADYFYMTLEDVSLNREIVKVTARSGNNLTVVRAQDGTTARSFSTADKAELRITVAGLTDIMALASDAIAALSSVYQPLDSDLTAWAAVNPSAYSNTAAIAAAYQPLAANLTEWASVDPSINGKSLVAAADYAAMRALLDLEVGTDFLSPAAIAAAYQPLLATLTSWGAITRASGFDTFVATPSSANLRSLLTDETGTGAAVFATSPTLVTPALGTPSALVLTNATGLPNSSVIGLGTAALVNTGTSGATIPLLNGTNTWSSEQTFSFNGVVATFDRAANAEYTVALKDGGTVRGYIGSNSTNAFSVANSGLTELFAVNRSNGNAAIFGSITSGGVAVPTISSTSTLTNKTLSSPTISGTVAGSFSFSGAVDFTNAPRVYSANPVFGFYETDASADEKWWEHNANAGVYTFRLLNDAYSAAGVIWAVDRTAHTAATFNFGSIVTLTHNGVAIPTISSTDTLSNKTLASPTLSGTVAGTPTFSGDVVFSGIPRLAALNVGADSDIYLYESSTNTFTIRAGAVGSESYLTVAGSSVLQFNGAAIPTISSTDTLSNKTLSSPTLSGTVAGAATWSATQTYAQGYGVNFANSGATHGIFDYNNTMLIIAYNTSDWATSIRIANGDVQLYAASGTLTWGGTTAYANGVAIPTISSTSTLTNKTLTSPTINGATLSGTLAGSPTLSGIWTFQATAIFGAVYDESIRIQNDGGYLSFYNDAGSTRRGFIYNGGTYLAFVNEITNGDFTFTTNGTGVLRHGGVEIPTLSSTSTLTNKTLSSPTLSGTVAGSPSFSGNVSILSDFRFYEAGAGTNEKYWQHVHSAGVYLFRMVNDAFNDVGPIFTIDRTGYSAATFDFGSGITLTRNSVAIPTISSTDTLSNKTLASPTLSGTVLITGIADFSSASPELRFAETDAGTNEKNWRISSAGGDFYLQALTEDYGTASNPIIISRTGVTIDSIAFGSTALTWNGANVTTESNTQTLTNKTLTSPVIGTGLELGHATDTTLTRLSAAKVGVEGKAMLAHDGSYTSGQVTFSTSDPSGGSDGDIWYKHVA